VQKYLENPFLIENRKTEYRCYVTIVSTQPFLVVFHKGFMKMALVDYTNESLDRFAHLTNLQEFKTHPEFEKRKETSYLNSEKLEKILED